MVPVQTQPISAFFGEDQSKSTILLSDLYSSGGSQNLYIDKLGRARTILGFSKQTATALTTNTGGSAAKVVALFPYRRTASGTFTRQIMAIIDDATDEWELWYSTNSGATFTFIADLGSGSINRIPSFVQFGDELYIVNGVIATRMWDGTTLTTAGATQLGAPTITQTANGPLTGNYRWKLVPRNTTAATPRKPGSVPSALTQMDGEYAALAWTADTDVAVVGYEVYRTAGNGAVYFYIDWVDGRLTVSYNDVTPDAQLIGRRVLAEHGDSPPTGCYDVTQHKGRVWYLRTDANPRRLWHADPGDADSVYVDENYIDCTDAQDMGDVGIATIGDFEGMNVVFLERGIHTISGTGELIDDRLDWRRRRTNARIGAASKRAIIKVPKGAKYFDDTGATHETTRATLAFFSPLGDIRLFDGDNDTIISGAVKDRISSFAYDQRIKIWAGVDSVLNHILFFFPESGQTECTACVAWNYQLGTMHYWTGMNFGHGIEAETSTAAQLMLMGENRVATGALVYEWKDTTTFDGTNITHTLMLKPVWLRDERGLAVLDRMHRHRYLDLMFETDASPDTVTVGWFAYTAADGATAVGTTTVSGTARVRARLRDSGGKYYHNFAARFRVTTTGGAGWILPAITLGYQQLPGRKRV